VDRPAEYDCAGKGSPFGLSAPARAVLCGGGIFNVRILLEQTRAQIEEIRTIGASRADEIEFPV
jgi:hypothetical protein